MPLLAGGFIKKGETFVATEDVRYFTYQESLNLLKDLKAKEMLAKKNILLQDIVSNQEEQIKKYKLAATLDQKAIQDYRLAIASLEKSLSETKNASVVYQEVITTQTEALKNSLKVISREKGKRRFERNLSYVLGLITGGYVSGAFK